MMTIDINKRTGAEFIEFPDSQPHIQLKSPRENQQTRVICSITSPKALLELLMVSNALATARSKKEELFIPYLMGARFDRIMLPGDSFDLQVISQMINSCGFKKVFLLDPHSDVAPALIKNSIVVTNEMLVKQYKSKDAVLIIPDAGAAKKASKYFEWNKNIVDSVQCIKRRNLKDGHINLTVLDADKCDDRNCIIIDDLCDGGGTFLAIANQIHASARVTLMVSHGIFSKGVQILEDKFEQIITTDSYADTWDAEVNKKLKVYPCLALMNI